MLRKRRPGALTRLRAAAEPEVDELRVALAEVDREAREAESTLTAEYEVRDTYDTDSSAGLRFSEVLYAQVGEPPAFRFRLAGSPGTPSGTPSSWHLFRPLSLRSN